MGELQYRNIVKEDKGKVCVITINRPEYENKLNIPCVEEITDALCRAEEDEGCRVIILTSSGDYFCNGGDLGDFRAQSSMDINKFGSSFIKLHTKIVNLSKPVIAAVLGHARGGGFSLVEACDLCIAAEDSTFGVPEVNSGLAPMMALTGVSRVLSRKGSMELALLGDPITASRAVEIGLVNRVFKREDVLAEAFKIADRISKSNPTAILLCKRLYSEADSLGYADKLKCGLDLLVSLLKSEDAQEVLNARDENRSPVWRYR